VYVQKSVWNLDGMFAGFNISTLSNAEMAHKLYCGLSSVLEQYGAKCAGSVQG
jgi:hypothetical protein